MRNSPLPVAPPPLGATHHRSNMNQQQPKTTSPPRQVFFINPILRSLHHSPPSSISPTRNQQQHESQNDNNHFSSSGDENDEDDDDDSDGEVTEKFMHLRDCVKDNPRVRQAKKAMRLVKRMERITLSKKFQDLITEERIPLSDDEDFNDAVNDEETKVKNDKESKDQQRSRGMSTSIKTANSVYQQHQQRNRATSIIVSPNSSCSLTSPHGASVGKSRRRSTLVFNSTTTMNGTAIETSDPQQNKKQLTTDELIQQRALQSLGQLSGAGPDSTFSSDKLCREFLSTARLAGDIQELTDNMIEIILEEANGPMWTNNDIYHQVLDCVEASQELEAECNGELDVISARFCTAADRVLRGAKEEVRTIHAQVGDLQSDNDKIVARIEQVKSEIRKELQRVEDLKLANSARRLCLLENGMEFSKMFSQSLRQDLEAQIGTQKIFGQDEWRNIQEQQQNAEDANGKQKSSDFFDDEEDLGDEQKKNDYNRRKSVVAATTKLVPPPPPQKSPAEQYSQSIRSRLRMLLSAAAMQVKGQKTADEQMLSSGVGIGKHASFNHQLQNSPVGGSRVLQSIEAVLAYL